MNGKQALTQKRGYYDWKETYDIRYITSYHRSFIYPEWDSSKRTHDRGKKIQSDLSGMHRDRIIGILYHTTLYKEGFTL